MKKQLFAVIVSGMLLMPSPVHAQSVSFDSIKSILIQLLQQQIALLMEQIAILKAQQAQQNLGSTQTTQPVVVQTQTTQVEQPVQTTQQAPTKTEPEKKPGTLSVQRKDCVLSGSHSGKYECNIAVKINLDGRNGSVDTLNISTAAEGEFVNYAGDYFVSLENGNSITMRTRSFHTFAGAAVLFLSTNNPYPIFKARANDGGELTF